MINKIQYLNRIPFDKQDIVIIGSAVLIAHNINIINNDLDLIVRPDILKKFLLTRGANFEENYIFSNHIELSWSSSKEFNELNKKANIIEGYSFMSLIDLRDMYTGLDREKDKEKILIINNLLNGNKGNNNGTN